MRVKQGKEGKLFLKIRQIGMIGGRERGGRQSSRHSSCASMPTQSQGRIWPHLLEMVELFQRVVYSTVRGILVRKNV